MNDFVRFDDGACLMPHDKKHPSLPFVIPVLYHIVVVQVTASAKVISNNDTNNDMDKNMEMGIDKAHSKATKTTTTTRTTTTTVLLLLLLL